MEAMMEERFPLRLAGAPVGSHRGGDGGDGGFPGPTSFFSSPRERREKSSRGGHPPHPPHHPRHRVRAADSEAERSLLPRPTRRSLIYLSERTEPTPGLACSWWPGVVAAARSQGTGAWMRSAAGTQPSRCDGPHRPGRELRAQGRAASRTAGGFVPLALTGSAADDSSPGQARNEP